MQFFSEKQEKESYAHFMCIIQIIRDIYVYLVFLSIELCHYCKDFDKTTGNMCSKCQQAIYHILNGTEISCKFCLFQSLFIAFMAVHMDGNRYHYQIFFS